MVDDITLVRLHLVCRVCTAWERDLVLGRFEVEPDVVGTTEKLVDQLDDTRSLVSQVGAQIAWQRRISYHQEFTP